MHKLLTPLIGLLMITAAPGLSLAQDHSGHADPAAKPAAPAKAKQPDHSEHKKSEKKQNAAHDDAHDHHAHDHDSHDHDAHGHDAHGHDADDHSAHQHHGDDHSGHDHSGHEGHGKKPEDKSAAEKPHDHGRMTGALGGYAMGREASGTSWQPEATPHTMGHSTIDGWTLMGHVMLNAVYDWQDGPRGDEKAFVSGMLMGTARRDLENGDVLNLRAMLSPDPFMGRGGYPLLLAAGETANGVTTLVDRQHPHDLFMELSASYSHRLSESDSLFFYAGLPGEPAFGPPAFMHRLSIMDSPEAPISHHWFDSTHITFGVLTAGWVHGAWKVEVSQFTGREPDQYRFDIEDPRFDSTSLRLSYNPDENWSLQISWAGVNSPEQLEPAVDETRVSASAIYTVPFENGGWWSTTIAWGFKDSTEERALHAFALESAYAPDRDWTVFGRAEIIESHELNPAHDIDTVAKISAGLVRDFHLDDGVKIGIGALYSVNVVPDELEPSYGGDPDGAMVFVRLVAGG